jgi:hypothetical protein
MASNINRRGSGCLWFGCGLRISTMSLRACVRSKPDIAVHTNVLVGALHDVIWPEQST